MGEKRKWIFMIIGLLVAGVSSYFISVNLYWLTRTRFDRTRIDEFIDNTLGNMYFEDMLIDELIINAFSYNVVEPRFYCLHEAKKNATIFNVTLA